jgi:hypothetical protein
VRYLQIHIRRLLNYFAILTVSYHEAMAVLGFITLLIVVSQLISGIMLALSFIPETMLVAISREEEDIEDLYTDDFF